MALNKVRKIAKKKGIKGEIHNSNRKNKKYSIKAPNGKVVHFGSKGYSDFVDHKDPVRRDNYRKRHSAIKLKSGKRAIAVPYTPAWLSYNVLW